MVPKDLLKKIRTIEIMTKRLVTDSLIGNYTSVFKGQGIEFSEVREYQYGDDVRSIDWNVTARQRKPYIKKFTEERELTVILAVDVSASLGFATRGQHKKELAAEISALLAFSAIRNGDKVGLLLFSDQVETYVPPRKDRQHILRIIRDVLYYTAEHKGTNMGVALDYLNRVHPRQAVTFVISDFFDHNYEKSLRLINRRHDIIPVILKDPSEMALPQDGYVMLEDMETGRVLELNLKNPETRSLYEDQYRRWMETQETFLRRLGLDTIDIRTDQSYVEPILNFFKKRMGKR